MKMIGVSSDCFRCRIKRRGLETVHHRHPYIEQDHREVLRHQATQTIETRIRFDNGQPKRFQDCPQRKTLGGVVVDHQDGRRPARLGGHGLGVASAGSHGPMAAINSTVSTGFGT